MILTTDQLIQYEVCGSWWASYISWGWLQNIAANHFSRKVRRKLKRYKWYMEKLQVTNNFTDTKIAHFRGGPMDGKTEKVHAFLTKYNCYAPTQNLKYEVMNAPKMPVKALVHVYVESESMRGLFIYQGMSSF